MRRLEKPASAPRIDLPPVGRQHRGRGGLVCALGDAARRAVRGARQNRRGGEPGRTQRDDRRPEEQPSGDPALDGGARLYGTRPWALSPRPKSFRLAADILAIRRFPNLVRPILQDLAARSGETVFLVVLDHLAQRVTYADIIDSANPVRYTVPTGTTRPLYVSSGGLMFLAYQDPAWIDTYIGSTRLEPLTPRTITDPEQLRERLATIRREGFAISLGETVPGAAGIAAPIFNADGSVTAGLLIGTPLDRFEQELPELKRLLREATTRVAGIAQALVGEKGAARD